MGKTINLILICILCSTIVISVNYDYIYNPYTAKQDRSIKLNQSGNNFTADYFIGDGSQLTGIEQGELILYFLDKPSTDQTGNRTLSSLPNSTEVTLTGTSLPDGNTLMGTWITDIGVPNINLLEGNIGVHVTGRKSGGTKNAQYFFMAYKTDASGDNVQFLGISEYTAFLTSTRTDYRIWDIIPETVFNLTDRIRIDGYVYVSGGGSAPSVEAYIQGASKTRIVFPVGAVSVEKFVPYTNAIKDLDLGNKNLYANNIDVSNNLTVGGNVGIGTTSPAYLLDVDGDFRVGEAGSSNALFVDATQGRVGIGTSNPQYNLHTLASSTSMILVQESTGYTGATAQIMFKTSPDTGTGYKKGGIIFKDIGSNGRGNLFLVNDIVDDAGSAGTPDAKLMISGTNGFVGIGTTSPSYPLTVGTNVSGISIYSAGNISASGYITRTETYDKSKGNALDLIKDADEYKSLDGTINHDAFSYSKVIYDKQVIDKEIITEKEKEECMPQEPIENETCIKQDDICEDIDGEQVCTQQEDNCYIEYIEQEDICSTVKYNETTTTYKTIQEEGVSLDKEIALLKQAVYELKTENTNLKSRLANIEDKLNITDETIVKAEKDLYRCSYKNDQECLGGLSKPNAEGLSTRCYNYLMLGWSTCTTGWFTKT